ncbi:MAG TPA: glycosyltransferase [Bacilli bacterium]
MASRNRLERKGYRKGYRSGRRYGYHLGRCQAVTDQQQSRITAPRNIKVLYVTSGLGAPYEAIDQSVSAALKRVVAQAETVLPDEESAMRLEQYRPDLLLTVHGLNMPEQTLLKARELAVKSALWWADDPYHHDLARQIAPRFDYVFTNEANCAEMYRQLGCKHVGYLPLGTDPIAFRPNQVGPFDFIDICFIGSAFANRVAFIDSIASYLAEKKTLISGYWWERLANYELLKKHIAPHWLGPEETAYCYNRAKIAVNLHRAHEGLQDLRGEQLAAVSVNPRTFDISACGALQLTDMRGELANLYIPGEEVITYATPEEFVEKAEYYLRNEDERYNIAFRGFKRTMSDHTYDRRIAAMLDAIFGAQ